MAEFAKVGPALAALRKAAGLRQKDVADRLGIGASTVGRFESVHGNPRAGSVDRYLKAIGCTPRDLLEALERVAGETPGPGVQAPHGESATPPALDPRQLARDLEELRAEFYRFRDDVTFRIARDAAEKLRKKRSAKTPKRKTSQAASGE